ncbi:hypothetical protein ACPYO6_08840 [Georgenia sp. Z1344]|uniref:hypothetical protein n=1 Tax=Georgenia sp. Z1344 TaxID=3416706 RepID=UPI003CE74E6A
MSAADRTSNDADLPATTSPDDETPGADRAVSVTDEGDRPASGTDTTEEVVTPGRFKRFVDTAVRVEGRRARTKVRKLRERMWRQSPSRLLKQLERDYVRSVARIGGAVGATAAFPVLGTALAVGMTSAQVAAFVDASARYVLAVAEVHGIHVDDVEKRRTLLLSALLGEEGSKLVSGQIGLSGIGWARTALGQLSSGSVRSVNRALTRQLTKAGANRGMQLALGRLAPFGIGMVLGYRGARALGRDVVKGTQAAFGPPPERFADDA